MKKMIIIALSLLAMISLVLMSAVYNIYGKTQKNDTLYEANKAEISQNIEYDENTNDENAYNSLTNKQKKEICNYIDNRYEYYDKLNGGYSGDKYSDRIMQEAANKYGLTVMQIEIIWMNMYSY